MALGELKVHLNKRQYFVVTGGPFNDCPKDMKGVKMAKEITTGVCGGHPDRRFPDARPQDAVSRAQQGSGSDSGGRAGLRGLHGGQGSDRVVPRSAGKSVRDQEAGGVRARALLCSRGGDAGTVRLRQAVHDHPAPEAESEAGQTVEVADVLENGT